MQGRLRGVVIRECVASLEEFPETVEESFDIEFIRKGTDPVDAHDAGDEDAPERLAESKLDIGEALVQHLSLAMAPFPRKPDAPSLAELYGRAEPDSPFAALAERIEKE